MKYISTRNTKENFTFKEVFLRGLAPDGGLYIPKKFPIYSKNTLQDLKNLTYEEIATKIIFDFCSDDFKESEIEQIVKKSYKEFRTEEVVKIKKIGNLNLLELFHGPTLAFKDIAMQVMGNIYEKFLENQKKIKNIIVATSGDTGAAAISALKGRKNLNIFVLHPHNRISKVQRKLMTTVKEKNVYNLAIKGNFDDCQNLVKAMFTDELFNKRVNMSGVNSINWARILVQVVYYFFSYFKIDSKKINYSVPTGNFGDVFSGYVAKKMGLPIQKLIIATNKNDILKRVIDTGKYKPKRVYHTISPSMDIQLASNFERLIFLINSSNSKITLEKMKSLKNKNEFILSKSEINKIKRDFFAESLNEKETILVINKMNKDFNILVDPHTAVGIGVLNKIKNEGANVVLSTAHPSKFPDAIKKATNQNPELPLKFKKIMNMKENFKILPNNLEEVKKFIKDNI